MRATTERTITAPYFCFSTVFYGLCYFESFLMTNVPLGITELCWNFFNQPGFKNVESTYYRLHYYHTICIEFPSINYLED